MLQYSSIWWLQSCNHTNLVLYSATIHKSYVLVLSRTWTQSHTGCVISRYMNAWMYKRKLITQNALIRLISWSGIRNTVYSIQYSSKLNLVLIWTSTEWFREYSYTVSRTWTQSHTVYHFNNSVFINIQWFTAYFRSLNKHIQ